MRAGSSGWWSRAEPRSPGTHPTQAAASLRAALQLWRGQALADLANGPGPRVEAARLEELRLSAVEDRIEADLALGRHADVVGELEALVAAHPLRERLQGQLMIALYRGGRQAEALKVYQAARRTLVEELGLEPGPALQRLERAILQQDASLDLPGRAAGVVPARYRDGAAAVTRRGSEEAAAGRRLGPWPWRSHCSWPWLPAGPPSSRRARTPLA